MDHLRSVSKAFRGSLPRDGHVSVFRIDALDRVGVPVVQANLVQPDKPATIGYGYGASAVEAEVGAVGELCEEVHVGVWVAQTPRIEASFASMVARFGADRVLDPLTLCLPAGSPYDPDMSLVWGELRRWQDGAPAYAPLEWVAAYHYQLDFSPRLIVPITNGLGAGLDLAHAVGHGVMEQLQRDGNVIGYRALDQGIVVEPDAVSPEVAELLSHLRSLGIEVTVKLASTEFGLANLYVVGDDRGEAAAPIQITACGEACHPDRERALRKALLEFCGSRSRKVATHGPIDLIRPVMPADYFEQQMVVALLGEEGRALEAMTEWATQDTDELRRRLAPRVFAERRRVRLSDLRTADADRMTDSAARMGVLADRLRGENMTIFYADCSPPGSDVRVVKVIVPGLESETMSYHRLGWRGVWRLRERDDALLLDEPREGARRVRLRPEDEDRAGGPAWFDVAAADALVDRLYPMYRECGPFSAQLMLRKRRAEA